MCLPEVVELFLEHGDHLRVARAAGPPAGENTVPGDRLLEVPALGLGIELAWEGVVELPYVLTVARLLVRGDLDADLLAIWHDRGEPPLAELVVGQPLEPVLELQGVHLLGVRQTEPLDAQREHPVDRALQLVLRGTTRGAEALHPGAAVAKVKVLLEHHLVQAALPWAVRALVVDGAQKAEAGLVVEAVGDDELGPGVERDVEGVGVAEGLRVAAEDQLRLVLAPG